MGMDRHVGQIRNAGFAKAVHKQMEKMNPDLAAKTSETDIHQILDIMLEVLAVLMRDGYRVIFEGFFSYFTKPIKRKCTNLHTNETWWTYKRRIRCKPMDHVKSIAETEITEEIYLNYKEEKEKKDPTV